MAKEGKETVVITAVYKAYLHCPKCAVDIQRPLLGIPGVQSVDVKFEKGEITVKGINIDPKKLHARLEKWSKKKVEFVSENKSKMEEVKKKEMIKTITMKTYLHCDECEKEARRRLLNHKELIFQGVHNVSTDIKAQTITVEGVIESEKLLKYMRKRVHKYVEILPPKEKKDEKKDQKKDAKKVEKKDQKKEEKEEEKKKDEKQVEKKEEKEQEKKKDEKKVEKKEEKEQEKKEEKVERKVIVEIDGKKAGEAKEIEKIEVKNTEGEVPYFIHYVYAPQLFSDENPNACSIL